MQLLNRTSLVGKLKEAPSVFWLTPKQNVMTFVLITESKKSDQQTKFHQQHQIVVEPPLIIEFAKTYLLEGSMVWVEGTLEYCKDKLGQKSCVVISQDHGFLFPLDSELQPPSKEADS
ncbi:MAG: single-stranded DNA-binding protein [Pseudomonadota bacterium]